jgi:cell division protein ZapA
LESKDLEGQNQPQTAAVKQSFDIQIGGLPLKIRSSHPEGVVFDLVRTVEEKTQQAMMLTRSGSLQNAALLAALNLAEELYILKKKAYREISLLQDRAQRLSQELEASKVEILSRDYRSRSNELRSN